MNSVNEHIAEPQYATSPEVQNLQHLRALIPNSVNEERQHAINLRKIYVPSCEFPEWVIDEEQWSRHQFAKTIVFYDENEKYSDIEEMLMKREPCNIAMSRLYNKEELQNTVGYSIGAYSRSTTEKLMPRPAIYCHATVKTKRGFVNVHVINLIGYAFDTEKQPDYQYSMSFPPEEREILLIQLYRKLWRMAFICCENVGIERLCIYHVGGGAFAGPFDMIKIFERAFLPLLKEYNIEVVGYDTKEKRFNGDRIPDIFDDPKTDTQNTVYVNAWDPWSMIGNGNGRDNSLDGYWGRSSNMSVLGWPKTNPSIRVRPVYVPLNT